MSEPSEKDQVEAVVRPQTATANIAAVREMGEVRAAMQLARQLPRDQIAARDRILMALTRQGLAEAAMYEYARGGQSITGLSIRAAEELARQWGNIWSGVSELSRSGGASECEAYAWDLETGFRDSKRFTVRHFRDTKRGGYVVTDERDIYELTANMGARRKRACILVVIPADIQEDAIRQCEITLKTKLEITPELIKSLIEKFSTYGVTPAQIEKRIQRRFDAITPALVLQLGKIFNSLKDGMSTPAEWFEPEEATAEADAEAGSTAEAVRSKFKARAGKVETPDVVP